MKKSTVSLALCAALLVSAFAGCGETAEITYDTTTWKSDATKHWHAATNGDESLKGDVDGHSDVTPKDGNCDVCGYQVCAHAYETEWSYDETNHWYASICGCGVKKDETAHTLNNMGDCTVCGADVQDPDVSTIEKAMEIANEQKGIVAGGKLTTDAGYGASVTTYQFFENYTYVKGEYSEGHYSLSDAGAIIAVDGNGYQMMDATEDNMNGPVVSHEVADEIGVFCGAEGLVNGLYEIAKENANADAVINQEATDGVYSFSFGYYIWTYGLYQINVEFTLDSETFAIATVDVTSVNYSTEDVEEVAGDEVTTYKVKEDAVAYGTSTVSYEQDEVFVAENPYSEEKITVKDFALTVYDEEMSDYVEATETTVETGTDAEVIFKAVEPESGLFSLATVEFSGENVTVGLWAESGLLVKYTEGESSFYLYAYTEGEYELTVTVNSVSKTLTVTAVKPVPSVVMTGTIQEEYGWQYFYQDYYGAGASVQVGEQYTLIVAIDKGAGVTVTADEAVSVSEPTQLSQIYDGGYYYENLIVYAYAISAQTAGVYELTISATDNTDAVTYFTLTVEEGSGEAVETQSINVTTTDNYGYFDEYSITATKAGTYTFNVPAGLGMYSKEAYDAYEPAEVDFSDNATGASFSVELAEGEEYVFYVGATTKTDWTITYTVSEGSTGEDDNQGNGGTTAASGTLVVEDNNTGAFAGTYAYSIGADNSVVITLNGAVSDNFIFSIGPDGNWYVQINGIARPQNLGVTELVGTINVMGTMYVFTFSA